MLVERGVSVPMRDGVVLRADVYRPTDAPSPALVLRTPYDRSVRLIPPSGIDVDAATGSGYALVCQDVRGMYESEGEFYPFASEAADGYDTVEWAAAQPWCDGAVGMVGRSYAATCQWLAASVRPPHLRAICPVVTGSDFFRGWVYQGGAFQLGFNLFWVWMMSSSGRDAPKPEQLFRHLPLRSVPLPDPDWGRFYFDWLAHPTDDDYWHELSINRRYPHVEVPALNVGGWFDVFLGGTLENFTRLATEGGSTEARAGTRLIVGPWSHGSTYGVFPDHSFGLYEGRDALDFTAVELAFFDRHLRGRGGSDAEARVRIFVMGRNEWRDEDEWPPQRARETSWFLRSGGRLDREGPGQEEPDVYTYDPHDPAPTVGGPTSLPPRMMKSNSGPLDQKRVEIRDDVLVYTSAPLKDELEATGPVAVVLHASTEGRDTDFVAKLCDVDADGRSLILAEGVLRARFRDGFEREVPVEPGRPCEYRIDLVATSNVFLPGHRIRLLITSSSFPRLDRNPNTGAPLGADGPDDLVTVRQTVFHDAARPSRLLLPQIAT
ncbi:MAG: CocE/NonD family hydrolase [Gaiellaceae bacterium]